MGPLLSFKCFGDAVSNSLQSKIGELISLLWDVSLGAVTNLILLPRNAGKLDEDMGILRDLRDDLGRKVLSDAAQPDMEVKNQVKGWLQRVQKLDSEVSNFQSSFERQSICITGLYLGYDAADKLKQVQTLMSQGNSFNSVVEIAAPDAETLARETEELRTLKDDIKRRVESEEAANLQMRRTNLVRSWLDKAEACLLQPSEGDFEVTNRLREVRRLKKQVDGDLGGTDLVTRVPPDAVEELPNLPSSHIVGGEETLAEIRRHLSNDAVGVIGVHGMGGVGKTTLVKKINNEFFESGAQCLFNMVIWATVSKDMNVVNIQKQIGDRVGPSSPSSDAPGQVDKRARSLLQALRRKQFLLFLDDVWEKLDLETIGIPHPGGRRNCKIVFTTRSLDVCAHMAADRIVRVEPLDELRSWQLFRRNVKGDAILRNRSIRPLARQVVARCGGLPLAILTVARAVSNKRTPNEWKYAIKALDDSASKLRGMETVLSILKFSYDALETDTMRTCLLYCALFPEDQEIGTDELVEYWVGEGLLDEENCWFDHIVDARGRGLHIIRSLQDACLLECGSLHVNLRYKVLNLETVRMHDTVRDMALQLSNDKFLAMAGKRLRKLPPAEIWGFAERISFMYNYDVPEFPSGTPKCPNLSTLLLNSTGIGPSVPDGFFGFMTALRVLDLSRTKIEEVPVEVCSLLRLQYLNLSRTSIRSLPEELGNLTTLRQLDLESTSKLESVPREAILKLSNLKVLKMWNSGYLIGREVVDLSSLECLDQLGDLQIDLGTCRSLKRLVESDLLSGCTTSLTVDRKKRYRSAGVGDDGDVDDDPLYGADGSLLQMVFERLGDQLRRLVLHDDKKPYKNRLVGELSFLPDQLPRLEYLSMHCFGEEAKIVAPGGGMILSILQSVHTLEMFGCHGFRDLTWARGLASLQNITLNDCRGIEQVLVLGESYKSDLLSRRPAFPVLREMRLYHLPALRNISGMPLLLPSLVELSVFECPRLKWLPLGPGSGSKIRMIRGTPEWWDGLEWDDAHGDGACGGVKASFLHCFRRFDLGKMFARRASKIRRRL